MIANGGKHITPSIIDQVQNRHGLILLKSDHRQCPNCSHLDWQNQSIPLLKDDRQRVSDPKSIYYLTTILEGVVQNGTAKKALALKATVRV
jgi:penicillin-binding protein 1A